MEVLKEYGFEINTISVGVGLILGCISFYIIYNYLINSKKDENEDKDKTTIYLYSAVPSFLIAILSVFLYSKYSKGQFSQNCTGDLLQEDFFH